MPKSFLSRADVAASITAYEELLDSAKTYRKSLATVAAAASAFGAALESCAKCDFYVPQITKNATPTDTFFSLMSRQRSR